MTDDEKLSVIGRPVYALYNNGYPVEYASFYYTECEVFYPQWIIDRSIAYSEKAYFPELRKAYESYKAERDAFMTSIEQGEI